MGLKTFAVSVVAAFFMTGAAHAVDIVWDGGDNFWNSNNWNGDQDASAVFGRNDGLVVGGSEIGTDAFINTGTVTYNPNADTGTGRDFRYRFGGTLNLGAGAVWQQDSNFSEDFVDGYWTTWDGDALNINGGTFRRTFSGNQESGGSMLLGSFRSVDNQRIEVNITDGGQLQNDGQLRFGAEGSSGIGIEVVMTIDDGHVDLTGGNNVPMGFAFVTTADLAFNYGYERDYTFIINFTGPGTLTVDAGGIVAAVQDELGDWSDLIGGGGDGTGLVTYEELWDVGILQANGASGAGGSGSGRIFSDFFTVTGTVGQDDYILLSNVPEPASAMLILVAFASTVVLARRLHPPR